MMDEKKLTNDEIIKDIERSTGMPSYWKKVVLDLIHQLQDENAGLKERGEKIINELHETIDTQKAEIERLTKNAKYWERKHCNAVREWEVEVYNRGLKIIELQKQVDELKEDIDEKDSVIDNLIKERPLIEKCAVKDTAKEIFTKLLKSENVREEVVRDYYGEEYILSVVTVDKIKELAEHYNIGVE